MKDLIDQFNQLIVSKRLAHAYLFSGDNLNGKSRLTLEIIKSLTCPNFKKEQKACGHCDMCKKVSDNLLADVARIEPDGKNIRVDQIRSLKDWLSTSPLEADFKLAVIKQAETMNASASNALLTMLEEPLDNVYIILYAQSASNVLPTIQSRVQEIHFQRPTIEERKDYIGVSDIDPSHADIIAYLSSDSTDQLINNYDTESMNQWIDVLNYFFRLLIRQDRLSFVIIQTHLKPYLTVQQSRDSLDYLLLLNHNILMFNENDESQAGIQTYFIKELYKSNRFSQSHLLKLYNLLLETKERIEANVTPQLAFERLSILACRN